MRNSNLGKLSGRCICVHGLILCVFTHETFIIKLDLSVCRVSAGEDEEVFTMDGGMGCTMMQRYLVHRLAH